MTGSVIKDIQVDPPFQFGLRRATDDRRYLDDQIQGLETHVVESLLGGIVCTWFQIGSGDVAAGQAVASFTLGVTGTIQVVASTSSLYAPSTIGLALTGGSVGSKIRVAIAGVIPASVWGGSNTSNGGYAYVNTTTGYPTFTALVPGTGSVVVGRVDPTGNMILGGAPSSPNLAPFGPSGKLVTPPDISTFTLVNPSPNSVGAASAASIVNHPSGNGFVIYGTANSAHECFNGAFVARGTKTVLIVQVSAPYFDSTGSGGNTAPFGGIYLYSLANNKAILWGPVITSGGGSTVAIACLHQNISGSSTATPILTGGRGSFPVWLKWVDDGTNFNFSYSYDGEFSHAPVFSESRTAFLPDAGTQIGVAAGSVQSTGTRSISSFSMWVGSWQLV